MGEPNIRFYAGAVLRSATGKALGTLCLIDHTARELSDRDQARLLTLARMLEEELRHELELQETRRRAYENAHFDATTGLPNARLFRDRLEQALTLVRRMDEKLLVAFVELSGLTDMAAVAGQTLTNRLLHLGAARLRQTLSPLCTAARWRDTTLAVLLPKFSRPEEPPALLELVRNALADPVELDGRFYHFAPVAGAAAYPDAAVEADELLQRAALALREAHTAPARHFHFYTSQMNAELTRRVELEHQLRTALHGAKLSVAYQPICDLETNEIVRVEALCRWSEPSRGPISPDEFITLAERSNLVLEVDRFVLHEAATMVKLWDRMSLRPIDLSVNISSRTLMNPAMPDWVQEELASADLAPARTMLEVTESCLVADMGLARDNIARCRVAGFTIGIDDFGTGFSSLQYLHDFAVDALKLDRVFVKEMVLGKRDASLARSIVDLARTLGLHVVAEGVETYDQVVYLRAYHCNAAQGYYYSAPVDATTIASMLRQAVH